MIKIRSKKSLTFFLIGSLLLVGERIVDIVFANLFFPLYSYIFYILVLLAITVFFNYKYLLDNIFSPLVFFVSIYLFLMFAGIYSSETYDYKWLLNRELLPIFVAFLFYSIWIRYKRLINLRSFLKIVLVFILISAITSIIGLNKYPLAARELSGALGRDDDYDTYNFYKSIGIAGYHFFYGLAFSMPVFIMMLKKHWSNIFQRLVIIIYIGIIFYAIIKSQMTTALLFAVLNAFFAVIGLKNFRKSLLLWTIVIGFISFIPNQFYADMLRSLSEVAPAEILHDRLYDLSIVIESSEQGLEGTDTHMEKRAERIPFLLSQIAQSPFLGGGESTGHVFWLDRLSVFGIVGIIPWIILFYVFIRETKLVIDKEYYLYFYLSLFSFIFIGFMKNNGGVLVYFFSFFMVSAILFLYSAGLSLFSNSKEIEINININEHKYFMHNRRYRLMR